MELIAYEARYLRDMAALFYDTVHTVNRRHYTQAQVDAWADGNVDLAAWHRSFARNTTLLAVEGSTLIGFADMEPSGHLDRLYVHSAHQGRGVAAALCDALEAPFTGHMVTVDASITARPFFERRGYHMVKAQQVERRGVLLTNYRMEKRI